MKIIIATILFIFTQNAFAHEQFWECSPAPGETIKVFSERMVNQDRWGRLLLSPGESVSVTVIGNNGESHDYSAIILLADISGGITKHGTMARYELTRGSLPKSLRLELAGIDELENQQRCAWNDNK